MEVMHEKKTVKKVGKKEEAEAESDIEQSITNAMRLRVPHFKEQADSLTLEGVRRTLEEDLQLEKYALDVHKIFIKQCLQECFEEASDQNASKSSGETVEGIANPKKETPELSEELQAPKEDKEPTSEDEEKTRVPSVQELSGGDKEAPKETKEAQALSKDTIKGAIRKRASYFKANSESVTMVGVRRLLEEDLKLDKSTLDPFKKFISQQLDEVLNSSGVAEPANGAKNKRVKNDLSKASAKVSSKKSSDSSDSEHEEVDEEEVKPKRKIASKGKAPKPEGKNRKRPAMETPASSNKRKKPVDPMSGGSDAEDDGNLSEDGHSKSSNEEPAKKKIESSTQVYGKHVEHLKSLIKSCGMSVPPAVYKRAKQAPESKREAALVKELEEILKREGLSTNPSEKEIKAVKKQKERTKELEGIDLSNIVSSSRRRSTSSFLPPPRPKTPVESDDEDNEDGNEDQEDDENSDDEADESNSEAASEESNDDAEDGSD